MILTCHLLIGALIATKIKIVPLAFLFAFLSHYLLDFIPHSEYSIKNIQEKKWKKCLPDFLKIILDLSLGILLVLILSENQPIIFIGALFATLDDAFGLFGLIFSNRLLKIYYGFHCKIHFLKNKKISPFWRIFSQVLTALTAVYFLL